VEKEASSHVYMLLGWEGYTKYGNGFNGVQGTFDSVEEAVITMHSGEVPDYLGTAQIVHMPSMAVVRQFEKSRKTGKWTLVR
jgi:hypothetical protein